MTALEDWAASLRAWTIPQAILEAAPESPFGFPPELFARRAVAAATRSSETPTTRAAREALPEGGEVLDVGVGGGATSIPLAGRAGSITGVDGSAELLSAFRGAADEAGVRSATVLGAWPEVAPDVPAADVVVCGHVVYNVWDLEPFVRALDEHARRRVVLEMTEEHPLAWMRDLWERFHDLSRPHGPTAEDCGAALRELGFDPERAERAQEGAGWFYRRDDAVALIRRRLCLPADRDPEVAEALGDRLVEVDGRWSAGPSDRPVVTMWWGRTAGSD